MVYVLTMHEVLLKSEQADVYTASIWVTPYLLPACYPDDFWHEYQALQHHLKEEEGSKIGRKKDEGKKEEITWTRSLRSSFTSHTWGVCL